MSMRERVKSSLADASGSVGENYREALQASSHLSRCTQGGALGCYLFALSGRLAKLDSIVNMNRGRT